ncbi:MAG: hypothetical protein JWQ98_941 [Chlorobi bacterium]|nr:hypothetical protein [Chlorobiota bacterium]
MKSFPLTLAAVAVILGGTSAASAQTTGKALQIYYPSTHINTSIRIGGTTKPSERTSEVIRFKNEIHRGPGIDTSFSEVLNTTAKQTMLSLDLNISMHIRDDREGNGDVAIIIVDLIDASNGSTLERITSAYGTLKGENSDTVFTRKVNLDLSKYNDHQLALMMRSISSPPRPILSFVDYPFNEATRNPEQIH